MNCYRKMLNSVLPNALKKQDMSRIPQYTMGWSSKSFFWCPEDFIAQQYEFYRMYEVSCLARVDRDNLETLFC